MLKQEERGPNSSLGLTIVPGTKVDLHMRGKNLIIKIYIIMYVYLASLG